MRYILIIFMIFINMFASNTYSKYNEVDGETIQTIIKERIGNKFDNFRNQNISTIVELNIKENGEMNYKIIQYSKNEEFNKIIENFIKEENGKIYYSNPKMTKIRIDFKP